MRIPGFIRKFCDLCGNYGTQTEKYTMGFYGGFWDYEVKRMNMLMPLPIIQGQMKSGSLI